MASELRVDTLKDSSGNNSVGMAYVAGGSAKSWVTYSMASASILDSLNTSSLTDNATGQFYVDKTNAFSNTSHSIAAAHCFTGIGGDAWSSFLDYEAVLPKTTTRHSQVGYSGGVYYDSNYVTGHIQGDLA